MSRLRSLIGGVRPTSSDRLKTGHLVIFAVGVGIVVAVCVASWTSAGMFAPDANTYLGAGERLNAGHPLYALSPGDRPIEMNPPYWTAPLLSPPPIAVAWRPLALLGNISKAIWWVAMILVMAACAALLGRRVPAATGIALILLSIPFALSGKYANVNGLLLLATIGVWLLAREGRMGAAAVVAAAMVAIKLTPAPLAAWLALEGGTVAVAWLMAGSAAILAVSILGSSVADHLAYLDVIRQTVSSGTTDISLPGIVRGAGVNPAQAWLVLPITWLGGLGSMVGLRLVAPPGGRHAAGFRIAVVLMTLASPVVHPDGLVPLLALIAPTAWPWRAASESRPSRITADREVPDLGSGA
jgi:Glycosyltransferase family 87